MTPLVESVRIPGVQNSKIVLVYICHQILTLTFQQSMPRYFSLQAALHGLAKGKFRIPFNNLLGLCPSSITDKTLAYNTSIKTHICVKYFKIPPSMTK